MVKELSDNSKLEEIIEYHIEQYHHDMSQEGNKPTLSPSSRAICILAKIKKRVQDILK